jgi:hypothetical protein
MSTISSATAANSLYATTQPSTQSQLLQNLNSLNTALQSGDTSSAQSALTTLQQTVAGNSPTTSTSQPFGSNTAANTDYNNLVSNVGSGNLSAAQADLSKLQADLKAHHGHGGHHAHGAPPPSTTSSTTDSDGDGDGSGQFVNVTV